MTTLDILKELMEKAKEEDLEITVQFETNCVTEITVKPFVPFTYACPYSNSCNREGSK